MTKAEQQARIDELEERVQNLSSSLDDARERRIRAEDTVHRMRQAIDALTTIIGAQ